MKQKSLRIVLPKTNFYSLLAFIVITNQSHSLRPTCVDGCSNDLSYFSNRLASIEKMKTKAILCLIYVLGQNEISVHCSPGIQESTVSLKGMRTLNLQSGVSASISATASLNCRGDKLSGIRQYLS